MTVKLVDYFANATTSQKQKFSIVDESNVTILPYAKTINYITTKYFNYVTPLDLAAAFDSFKDLTLHDVLKAVAAYDKEYNPIENYSSYEKAVNTIDKGNIETTKTPNLTETRTPNLTETRTPNTTDTTTFTSRNTENFVTTFDSTNERPNDKTTESGSESRALTGTDSTTRTGTETTATTGTEKNETEYKKATVTDGNDTITAAEVNINELTKNGNIGVMTAAQMLKAELDLRMNPVLELYIDKFINNYCYMRLGGDFE